MSNRSTTKRCVAILFAVVIASVVAFVATYSRFHAPAVASTPAAAALPAVSASTGAGAGAALALPIPLLERSPDLHAWSRLSPEQHDALAPFAGVWDHFNSARKDKWLKIAANYRKLAPEAQKRLHTSMSAWVRMTPDQRRTARENYQVSKVLPTQARERAWRAYQKLPEEQKRRLASSEKARHRTVVSAPPSAATTELRDLGRLTRRDGAAAASTSSDGAAKATTAAATGTPVAPVAGATATPPVRTPAPAIVAPPRQPPASLFNDNAQ